MNINVEAQLIILAFVGMVEITLMLATALVLTEVDKALLEIRILAATTRSQLADIFQRVNK